MSTSLPLRSAALRCDARAGVARVILEQRFANSSSQPLRVTYKLPLPDDAAVSGFRFRIGDRIVEGKVDRRVRAREIFDEAIANGRAASILEQERASLFVQEIGNIPPGAEVVCEITLDQPLRWLEEGSWEWRFPLAAAPRYLGAEGRVADAPAVTLDVASELAARASLAMSVRDEVTAGRSPESPSHPLSCHATSGIFRVELGSGNAVSLDRDVVVRWPVAEDDARVTLDVAGPREGRFQDAHALLTVVPPRASARRHPTPRALTLLLDTSGSMNGPPIDQLKRVALAMIASLGEQDRFEIIEFSSSARRFHEAMVAATPDAKQAASTFVRDLRASGGTEMREGILAALRPVRRDDENVVAQVVLVTDGLIGFEQEIVREILSLLPGDARLHTVGVGSSVNRSLTRPAARAGRGIEVVLGLGEDPERAVARLLARSVSPLVTEVEASGDALVTLAPMKIPDLFAGAPVLLSARTRAEGGEIVLRGRTAEGRWEQRVRVPRTVTGEGNDAVVALFGREAVEDAEMRVLGDPTVESLGLSYRIATRLTSWVAVDSQASVDPRDPSSHVNMPQALPYGTSMESFGLRPASPVRQTTLAKSATRGEADRSRVAPPAARAFAPPPAPAAPRRPSFEQRETGSFTGKGRAVIVWKARLVLARPGELVIEIAVFGGDLEWAPGSQVVASGATLAVDATRTTRAGTYPSGTTIRLVLSAPLDFDPTSLRSLTVGDVNLIIEP